MLYIIYWLVRKESANDSPNETIDLMINIINICPSTKCAYVALKISIDIFKIHKSNLDSCAESLYNCILNIYARTTTIVKNVFEKYGADVGNIESITIYSF